MIMKHLRSERICPLQQSSPSLIMELHHFVSRIKSSGALLFLCFAACLLVQPASAKSENLSVSQTETDTVPEASPGTSSDFPENSQSEQEPPQSFEGLVEDADGNLHFYEQGQMLTATLKKIGEHYYYFDENGIAAKSCFVSHKGKKYYFDENGMAAAGWKTIENKKYYFKKDGIMLTGLRTIDGKKYFFSKNTGSAVRGLKNINGSVYYFGKNYRAVTGWKKLDGMKYYFKKNGARTTGWAKIGGKNYYFKKSGARTTGWAKIGEKTYYFKKNGVPVSGLKKIDSALYYFKESGKLIKDKKQSIDGKSYYFGSDGKAELDGWLKIGAAKYFADKNGTLKYFWKKTGNTWHLYDTDKKSIFASNTLYQTWNRVQSMSSATSYFIAVNTSACRVMIFKGSKGKWVPVKFWLCSPGKSSTPTVKGIFTVLSKGYCFGSGFTCYYYTQFHGNYLFHSTLYYQGTRRSKDGRLGMRLSHGCVRLHISNAKWIYNIIPKGTKVYTF